MNLSGIFTGSQKSSETGKVRQNPPSLSITGSSRAGEAVRRLTSGQTLQGEIISRNGREVQIAVGKDVVLTARLDQDFSLSEGQLLTFEVKSNGASQISLRPLFENLARDPNIVKALEAARIPVNDATVEMVSALMDEGMPIDKGMLQSMNRQLLANPSANPSDIVAMNRLQIPVTTVNLEQYVNYRNYEHQITGNIEEILHQLPDIFQNMLGQGEGGKAVEFYLEVLKLFTGKAADAIENGGPLTQVTVAEEGTAGEAVSMDKDLEQTADKAGQPADGTEKTGQPADGMEKTGTERPGENILRNVSQSIREAENITVVTGRPGMEGTPLLELLSPGERQNLAALLEPMGFTPEELSHIRDGTAESGQALRQLHGLLTGRPDIGRGELLSLLGSREYAKLLNSRIGAQWLLEPREVGRSGRVEELFERVREQTARLTQALDSIAKGDTALAKSLTRLQNNVDFINQLNQTFSYVQLPLKMYGGNTHGELYVYTNKKSLARKDGSVSALLHLDMETLGAMDIYVTMQEQKVRTSFSLEKESTIDLIEAHIDQLDERLRKRGYTLHAEVAMMDAANSGADPESNGILREMLGMESGKTPTAKYSFDVRA